MLGKHSGLAAVRHALGGLGLQADEAHAGRVLERVRRHAVATKRAIEPSELAAFHADTAPAPKRRGVLSRLGLVRCWSRRRAPPDRSRAVTDRSPVLDRGVGRGPAVVVVLGTNDIASAIGWRMARTGWGVLLLRDLDVAVLRRGMALDDALEDGTASLDGVVAVRAADPVAAAAVVASAGGVAVGRFGVGALIAARVMGLDALVDARMHKYAEREDLQPLATCAVGVGPGFVAGSNVHVAVESLPGAEGAVVAAGPTASPTGKAIPLGGAGRNASSMRRCPVRGWPRRRWGCGWRRASASAGSAESLWRRRWRARSAAWCGRARTALLGGPSCLRSIRARGRCGAGLRVGQGGSLLGWRRRWGLVALWGWSRRLARRESTDNNSE